MSSDACFQSSECSTPNFINLSIQNISKECVDVNRMPNKALEGTYICQHKNQPHSLPSGSALSSPYFNSQQISNDILPPSFRGPSSEYGSEVSSHNTYTDNEKPCGRKVPKADDCVISRLVVVSSKVRNISSLKHALLAGVNLLQYNCDSQTLDDIQSLIAQTRNGQKVYSIAFILSCSGSSLQLVTKEEKLINRDGCLDRAVQEFFLHIVQNHFMSKDSSCRIDFLGWCSLQSADTVPHVVTELQTLTGVSVGAWPDLSGQSQRRSGEVGSKLSVGELYFRLEKLRNWSGRHQQSLAGFEKIRTVGKGAYGAAVLYKKKDDDSLVILKEINMHDLKASERQLALNEISVLAMLDHPNIISYYDSFEEDGVLMIEMEYADNGTLSQYLSKKEHPLEEKDILAIFQQIVAGIRHIHSHNILHRDLKTDNIFLTKEGVVKIGDFGISKMMGSANKSAQTVLGTPYYISPEMCEGKQYSFKSDIWALGCILYEMTCLHKTFEGSNLPAVVNKIMKLQFAPIKGSYSEEFKELITDMLKKDPKDRPESNYIMYHRLPLLINRLNSRTSDQDDELISSEKLNKKEKLRSVLYYFESSTTTLTCINDLPPRMKIKHMAVGPNHVIVTTTERQVFTWGHGGFGQLGHGDTNNKYAPTLVESLKGKSITSVCCGLGYSVFGSDNGLVLTCGDGSRGCLGHGDWCSITRPRLIETLLTVDVIVMASGLNHVVVIGRDGQVLSWGDGLHGQLGLGSEEKHCQPVTVQTTESVVFRDVQCGVDGTMLISDAGGVFACGNNEHNKLGLNNRQGFLMAMKNIFTKTEVEGKNVPTPVRALARHCVLAVSMGAHHTAVIVEHGHVITFGRNSDGQLGTQNTKQSSSPVEVKVLEGKVISHVQCGEHYTVACSKDHQLYYWGLRYTLPPVARLEDPASQSSCNDSTAEICIQRHKNADQDVKFKLSQTVISITDKQSKKQLNEHEEATQSHFSYIQHETDSQGFRPLSSIPKRSHSASSQEYKEKEKEMIRDDSVVIFYPMEIIKLRQGNEKMLLGNFFCHGENLFIQMDTTAPPPRRRTFKKRITRHKSSQSLALAATHSSHQMHQNGTGFDDSSYCLETAEVDSQCSLRTWLRDELAQSIEDINDGNEPDDNSDHSEEDGRADGIDSSMSHIQVNRTLTPVANDISYIPHVEMQALINKDKSSSCNTAQPKSRLYSLNSSGSNSDAVQMEMLSDSSSGEVVNAKKKSSGMSGYSLNTTHRVMASRQKVKSVRTCTKHREQLKVRNQVQLYMPKDKTSSGFLVSGTTSKRREELLLLELDRIKQLKKQSDARIQLLEKEKEAHQTLLKQEAEKIAKQREKVLLAEVEELHLEIKAQQSLLDDQQRTVEELQDQLKKIMAEQKCLRNGSLQEIRSPRDDSVSATEPAIKAESLASTSSKKNSSRTCMIQ